jgi:hypothetical protein
MKQSLEQDVVGLRKSPFELRKPIVRKRREGVRFSQRSRPQAIDLRHVFGPYAAACRGSGSLNSSTVPRALSVSANTS